MQNLDNGLSFKEEDFVISPEDLVKELLFRIDRLWFEKPKAGNKEWTTEVKKYLAQIGSSLFGEADDASLETIYTGVAPDVSEFLFDVVWWCRRSRPTNSEYLAMAAEIEWASFWWGAPGETFADHVRDRVCEDFSKLTIAKCPLKLMIFCTDKSGPDRTHAPMQKTVLDEIDRYLGPCKHLIPGETYLFIDVASQGQRSAWMRQVDRSGCLSPRQALVAK